MQEAIIGRPDLAVLIVATLEACNLVFTLLGSSTSSSALSSVLGELAGCFSLRNDASWSLLSDLVLDLSQRESA